MKRTQPDTPRRKQNAPRVEPSSRQAESDPVVDALKLSASWRIHPF